jgi:hypothetical protein
MLVVDMHPVDWNGRHEDSCGSTGLGRPHRRLSAEEAPRHARGKRSAWSGNQQDYITQPFIKLWGADCKNKNLFLQSAFSNFILLLVPSHNSSDGV